MALTSVVNGLADPSPDHPGVSGVVVDIPSQGGFVTVVALTDHTTSMYTTNGGGTIGIGGNAQVAAATQKLLCAVQGQLGSFNGIDNHDLPRAGSVRFHVLTQAGSRCEDVSEDSFWGRAPHQLMPVIASTQELISAIGAASPR
jgi:hypothetical protein